MRSHLILLAIERSYDCAHRGPEQTANSGPRVDHRSLPNIRTALIVERVGSAAQATLKGGEMTTPIRRRTMLRGAAGVAVSATLSLPQIARAAEPLVINSYGGPFEKFMREQIIPVFEKDTGIKTTLDIGLAKDWLATLRASGPENPPYDVLLMNGISAALLRTEGFFEQIPVSEVPNLKDVFPIARQPNDVGVIAWMQPLGIAYRTDLVKAVPNSWKD